MDSPFYKAENVIVPAQQMYGTFNTEGDVVSFAVPSSPNHACFTPVRAGQRVIVFDVSPGGCCDGSPELALTRQLRDLVTFQAQFTPPLLLTKLSSVSDSFMLMPPAACYRLTLNISPSDGPAEATDAPTATAAASSATARLKLTKTSVFPDDLNAGHVAQRRHETAIRIANYLGLSEAVASKRWIGREATGGAERRTEATLARGQREPAEFPIQLLDDLKEQDENAAFTVMIIVDEFAVMHDGPRLVELHNHLVVLGTIVGIVTYDDGSDTSPLSFGAVLEKNALRVDVVLIDEGIHCREEPAVAQALFDKLKPLVDNGACVINSPEVVGALRNNDVAGRFGDVVFTSPIKGDLPPAAEIHALFIGQELIALEASVPQDTCASSPQGSVSTHTADSMIVPMKKHMRDLALADMQRMEYQTFIRMIDSYTSALTSKSGFGSIRLQDADLKNTIGIAFATWSLRMSRRSHDFLPGTWASSWMELAMRVKMTPDDPLAGLTSSQISMLPDHFDRAVRQRQHEQQRSGGGGGSGASSATGGGGGEGAAGAGAAGEGAGAGGGGGGGGDGIPPLVPPLVEHRPLTFRRNDELLGGHGAKLEEYLVTYTQSFCGSALDVARQRRMAKDMNRLRHGFAAAGDEKVPPINPVFQNRLVTGTARRSKNMDIETWWHSSVGCAARVQACNGGLNKCGIKNTAFDARRGMAPRCMSCNSE